MSRNIEYMEEYRNYTAEYYPEFLHCFDNKSSVELANAEQTWHNFLHNYRPTPVEHVKLLLAALSLIINLPLTLIILWNMKRRRLPKRPYLFLSNRSAGDSVLAAGFLLEYLYLSSGRQKSPSIGTHVQEALLNCAVIVGFWSVSVSLLCTSLLKLFSVYRPFWFHSTFRFGHCLQLLMLSWLLALAMAIVQSCVTFASVNPSLRALTGCSEISCEYYTGLAVSGVRLICYLTVLSAYIFACIFVYKMSKDLPPNNTGQLQLKKMAFHVINYALFHAIILVQAVVMYTGYDLRGCSLVFDYYNLNRIKHWAETSSLVRTLTDPILSILIDVRLRYVLFEQFTEFSTIN